MQSERRENTYSDELQNVIRAYIKARQQVKPDSRGVIRAQQFLKFISHELLEDEKLQEVQLMWRMLDYVTRKDGGKPFETSKRLRALVLQHLGKKTGVTNDKLNLEEQTILIQEITENNNKQFPFFTATHSTKKERLDKAKQNIITNK